ncbi:MAG: hypothetical protein AAF902_09215 [Chloroflexota bacterium]
MINKRVYAYTKKSRWLNLGKTTALVFLPLLLLLLLFALWGNLFLDLDLSELVNRIRSIFSLFAIGIGVGSVVGFFIRESLRFELDDESIRTQGWGQTQLTIPYADITEIRKSRFGVVQIKSEHLNRVIHLNPSYFEPKDYAEIQAVLEAWKEITPITGNEFRTPLIVLGCIVGFGILVPIFITSTNPVVKATPFIALFIFTLVIIFLMRNSNEAPSPKFNKFATYFFAFGAALMAVLIIFN